MSAIEPTATDSGLIAWGWDEGWAAAFAPSAVGGLLPGRVTAQHRGRWLLVTAAGDLTATLTGKFRHEAADGELPAVGDWVGYIPSPHVGQASIDAVLPRRAALVRRAAGSRVGAQVVAANVDVVFIATSFNGDLNPRRLERYVAMGRESGARVAVLLTKADLADDDDVLVAKLSGELGVAVIALSARTGLGLEIAAGWLAPGRTFALVGSSGVGKSTLLNRLAGEELMATREIREDDSRGRHTTTHRELFQLPGGALMLDTPGMREIGLWDADEGLEDTFADIAGLAAQCRFADCSHRLEPGCAIRSAVSAGRLDESRVKSYRRLWRELSEQPSPAVRRVQNRRFAKAVRNASVESMERKTYRARDY